MYGSRTLVVRKKSCIIFNQRFKEFKNISVGDKGQCLMDCSIVGDRKESAEDGTEYLIKTLEIEKIEIVDNTTSTRGI
jgi:hypothetical protein